MSERGISGALAADQADLAVYCKPAAVTMIWGGTFVAGRYLAGGLSPLLAASLRFFLASLALLGFMAVARIPQAQPSLKQLGQLALLGFFGIFFYNLCFCFGLQQVNASRASLIVALNPAVIALASWALFKERLSRRKLLGILSCLAALHLVLQRPATHRCHPLRSVHCPQPAGGSAAGRTVAGRATEPGDGIGRSVDSRRPLPVQQTPCGPGEKGDFIENADKGFYAV